MKLLTPPVNHCENQSIQPSSKNTENKKYFNKKAELLSTAQLFNIGFIHYS